MPEFDLGTAKGKIQIDSGDVKKETDKAKSALSNLTSHGSKALGGLGRVSKTAGKAVGASFLGMAGAAAYFAKSAIAAGRESNLVAGQTKAALKSTGNQAGVTGKQIASLAGKIRDYSGIDDEAVQAGENMLLTFTKVQNRVGEGNDIFTRATKITADMSVALGQDMSGAALQLGKALNDPQKGVTKLTRVGVTFDDQQKKQIETMTKAGDIAGAQGIILDELAKEFGGSAKAMGKADPGAILQSQMGDVQEAIGQQLLPVLGALLGALKPIIMTIAPPLLDFIKSLGGVFTALLPAVKPVVEILAQVFTKVLAALIPVLEKMAPIIGDLALEFGEALIALAPLIPPLGDLLLAILPLLPLIVHLESILIKLLVPAFVKVIEWVTNIVDAFVRFVVSSTKSWDAFKKMIIGVWKAIKSAVLRVVGDLIGWLIDGFVGFLKVFSVVAGKIIDTAAWAFGWIPGIGSKIKAAKDAFHRNVDLMIGKLERSADKFHAWGDTATKQADRVAASLKQIAVPAPHIPGLKVGGQILLGSGTRNWKGGFAVTGERGTELGIWGGMAHVLGGKAGGQLSYIPKGAMVLPHGQSRAIAQMLGIPGFASGLGPIDRITRDLGISQQGFQGFGNSVADAVKKILSSIVGGVSGTVSQWIKQAMVITGVNANWFAPLATLVRRESGGNPHARNPNPVASGQHAEGLVQTIPSTFNAYRLFGSIFDPVANLVAGIRYILSRYGSIFNIPGLLGNGTYRGYRIGGILPEDILGMGRSGSLYNLHQGERVSPANQHGSLKGLRIVGELDWKDNGHLVLRGIVDEEIRDHDRFVASRGRTR